MEHRCKNCRWFSGGVTDRLRHEWSWSNWGRCADGVCNLYFPRGYVDRKPPHPARAVGHCFQWEEMPAKADQDPDQMSLF